MRNSALIGVMVLLCLSACKYDANTTLVVHENAKGKYLKLLDEDGNWRLVPPGQFKAKLILNKSRSKLHLYKSNGKDKYTFRLDLPKKREILYSNEPLVLPSLEIKQPISLVIYRTVDIKLDRININVFDASGKVQLGTMQVSNKSGANKNAYDRDKGEFLQSYQKVRYLQRGLVFKIDAAADSMLIFGGNVADAILNYGAMVYISPWVYTRYWHVKWILSDKSDDDDYQKKKWQEMLSKRPVIDYISWVHSGNQHLRRSWMSGKKEHQLRMVYTGACNSGSSSRFITSFNSAVGGGHRNTSASPLFQFSMIRNWVYGKSYKNSMDTAWRWGKGKVKVMEWLSFAKLWQEKTGVLYWYDVDDMLYDSELMLSYTPELPASKLYVSLSAVPKRSSALTRQVVIEEASKFMNKKNEASKLASMLGNDRIRLH